MLIHPGYDFIDALVGDFDIMDDRLRGERSEEVCGGDDGRVKGEGLLIPDAFDQHRRGVAGGAFGNETH